MKMNKYKLFLSIFILFLIAIISFPALNAQENSTSEATNKEEVEFKLRKEEIVFIPYRELDKLLDKQKDLVYMSYDELKKLITEKSQIRPLAPVNYVIKDLALNGTVKKDHVSFAADYKIQVLNKEWTYIPIMSTQVGLKSAVFDNKPAPISVDNSQFRILTDELGEHTLKLNFDVKLQESGNTKNFNFNMPDLPITRLTLTVPETPVKLNIRNASGQRSEVKDNKTITYANITGKGDIYVDWKSNLIKLQKVDKPEKPVQKDVEDHRPSKVIAGVETLITVDEGILQGYTTYNCQIFHKPVEKLNLYVPDDENLQIISVTSPGNIVKKDVPDISDPNGDKPGKVLTVYFNSKIKDNAVFNIAYEKTFENKKIKVEVPDIHLIGKEINNTSGYVAVQSTASLEVKALELKNISVTDVSELPYDLSSLADNPILLAYSYLNNTYDLALEIIPHEDAGVKVAVIDKASLDSRMSSDGILTTLASYELRNMSQDFFKFTLPENAEYLTATINGNPVQAGKETIDDLLIYSINIKNQQNETPFTLGILYRENKNFNFFNKLLFNAFKLQAPSIKNVPTIELRWVVYLPEELHYKFSTNLQKGIISIANIHQQMRTRDKEQALDSYNEYDRVASQVANIAPEPQLSANDGRVAGIIGTKYELPPVINLKSSTFSDYLVNQKVPTLSVFAFTNIIDYIIFILMIILGWKLAMLFKYMAAHADNIKARAKFVILWAVILYLLGIIFGSNLVWFPVILGIIAYIIYFFYDKRKEKIKQHNASA
jgi:hypothetical protein